MKLLHTSDWHIGQKLHGNEREEEFQLFFEWLHQLIKDEQIEVLLISGDVFDVGFPSNNALKLYYKFLTSLIASTCRQVIITGGNHDYISTLEAPSDVLSALNIQVIGGAKEIISDELIEVRQHEELKCVVAAVPFLRDKDIRQINAGESYEDSVRAISQGIIKHYQHLADEAKNYNCPCIAMGHLFVQGAGRSESERDIHVGNLAGLSVESFPDAFDYLALGHIHRPQKLNSTGTIRYSGSPLPLSFSERKDNKQVVVLSIEENELKNIESIAVPTFRKLIAFNGNFKDVSEQLMNYKSASRLEDWAEINVEEEAMDTSIRSRFETLIDEVNSSDNQLLIVKPSLKFITNSQMDELAQVNSLNDLSINQVFENLLATRQVLNQKDVLNTFTELVDDYFHQSENE